MDLNKWCFLIFTLTSTFIFRCCLPWASRLHGSNSMTELHLNLLKAWSHHIGILASLLIRRHRKTAWREGTPQSTLWGWGAQLSQLPSWPETPSHPTEEPDRQMWHHGHVISVQSSHQITAMLRNRTGTSWSKSTQRTVGEKKKVFVAICWRKLYLSVTELYRGLFQMWASDLLFLRIFLLENS